MKFLVAVVTAVVCLLFCEIVIRIWLDPLPNREERIMAADPQLGWTNIPGISDVWSDKKAGYSGHVTFDELGLRSNGEARLPNPDFSLLIVGDSTTVGIEVDDDQTYPALLERKLRALGIRANIYNGGVRGYGTDQAYFRIRQFVPIVHPDAVLYMSCVNDFTDNITIKDWRHPFSKPAFVMSQGKLTVLNQPAQPFDRTAYAIVRYGATGYTVEKGSLKIGGLADWLRDRVAIYNLVETYYYAHIGPPIFNVVHRARNHAAEKELLRQIMLKMREASPLFLATSFTKEKGGINSFGYEGGTYDDGYDEVRGMALKEGIPHLDIQPFFKPGTKYDWPGDGHYGLAGHQRAAEGLLSELLARPELKARLANRRAPH